MIQSNHGIKVDWMEEANAVSWYYPNRYNWIGGREEFLDNESFISNLNNDDFFTLTGE